MKKRLALLVAFVLALSIAFAFPVSANAATAERPENGFYEDNFGRWYFYRDGEMVTDEIIQYGDYFYAFNNWGEMYDDQTFSMRVEIEGEHGTYSDYLDYRAKSGGPLYVNEWYWNQWDECWYYYGENGVAPSYEFMAVNGTTYYFTYDGHMMADGACWAYDGETSGYFAFDENGAYELIDMTSAGWQEVKGNWYYISKENEHGGFQLAYDECVNIDGTDYLFNDNYAMATDEFVEIWNQETYEQDYYYANAYGQPYTGWIQPYANDTNHPDYEYVKDNWYYYGADGKALRGYHNVDGTDYYFAYSGYMVRNSWGIVCEDLNDPNDASYAWVTDQNGVASRTNKGWMKCSGSWRYFDGEDWLVSGPHEIDGNYYFFRNVEMLDDDTYDLYRAKEGGVLYRNEWYQENSSWYYYGDRCEKLTNTVAEINGVYYAFNYSGQMKKNQVAYDDYGNAYILDKNGVGTLVTGTGWYAVGNNWAYAEDGQLVYSGWKTIDGSDYYFDGGYILQDTYWYVEETAYLFSAGGAKITDIGWHMVDGEWYYVKEARGAIVTDGWYEVDGQYYYFWPEMMHNTVWEDFETGYVYGFDTNGAYFQVTGDGFYTSWPGSIMYIKNNVLLTDAWEFIDGYWYYFNEFGEKSHGAVNVNGTPYLFDGEGRLVYDSWCELGDGIFRSDAEGKVLTGYQYVDGKYYLFSKETGALHYGGVAWQDDYTYLLHEDGSVYGYTFTPNTWYCVDGAWYYFADGYFLKDEIKEVDGFVYAFDYSGQMVVDEEYYGKYNNYWSNYYFDEAGHMVRNAWYYTPYGYKYFDEDGDQYYYGYYTIDGVEYCFDSYLQIGTFVHDGDLVTTTEGGAIISKTPMSDGWTYSNGKYYYVVDGDYNYTGWVGSYYVRYGEMVYYDTVVDHGEYYYINANGVYVNSGWYNRGSVEYPEYIYANPDGTLMHNEWAVIDGVRYYFDWYYMCAGGIRWIDGEYHEFAEGGAWLGEVEETTNNGYENGWVWLDGEYYYSYNGRFLRGNQYIDGAWYRFGYYYDEEETMPAMLADAYYDGLYYTASGALLEATGWQIINGYYVYFDGDHCARTGLIEVDGVQYFIGNKVINEDTEDAKSVRYMVSNGYVVFDGELYYASASGALTKVTNANGWYWVENWQNYVYGQNGELLRDGEYVINGITYGFYYDGEMVVNTQFKGAYYDASGAKLTANGWHWVEEYEVWIYNNNGKLYENGLYFIDGVAYYFSGCVWVQ